MLHARISTAAVWEHHHDGNHQSPNANREDPIKVLIQNQPLPGAKYTHTWGRSQTPLACMRAAQSSTRSRSSSALRPLWARMSASLSLAPSSSEVSPSCAHVQGLGFRIQGSGACFLRPLLCWGKAVDTSCALQAISLQLKTNPDLDPRTLDLSLQSLRGSTSWGPGSVDCMCT